jgi:Na+-transporting NADH:ubiquinone oxidoreductase subunit NqrB
VFAIIVVKCLFGGLGCNFANPAATARVFLLVAFATSVGGGAATVFTAPDLVASATPLELIKFGNTEELPSLLNSFLDTLPESEWQLFCGRYWHGHAVKELARAYGLTPKAVTMRLSRTREKLRTYLNERGYHL